jgi:hypothetical protein
VNGLALGIQDGGLKHDCYVGLHGWIDSKSTQELTAD